MVSVGPAGEVRRLLWPRNLIFFLLLVCCLPSLCCGILVSRLPCIPIPHFAFLPSPRHHSACLLCFKADSYPASWLEGLRRNLVAIGSTLPPPAAGSSLGGASVLAQSMGEGLSWTFAGQASGKWSVCLSRFLIFENARGLQGGGLGGRHFHGTPRGPWR